MGPQVHKYNVRVMGSLEPRGKLRAKKNSLRSGLGPILICKVPEVHPKLHGSSHKPKSRLKTAPCKALLKLCSIEVLDQPHLTLLQDNLARGCLVCELHLVALSLRLQVYK